MFALSINVMWVLAVLPFLLPLAWADDSPTYFVLPLLAQNGTAGAEDGRTLIRVLQAQAAQAEKPMGR